MTLEKATELVTRFEGCTLPKEQWTHEAHFIMAFWYCLQYPLPAAVQKIRQGIKAYNVSVGGQNTDSTGYHETITLFYIKTISAYIISKGVTEFAGGQVELLVQQPFIAKDYALQFYSKALLTSKEARKTWMQPDLKPLT
jgi:hypothetical protein